MKLLLDTHIWIWSVLAPENLVSQVSSALENEGNELWLSPISVWEVLVLVEKRRLVLGAAVDAWIRQAISEASLREAPITHEVAVETSRVRLPHRDPADKFLLATARVFELTLVTGDERLLRSKQAAFLSNR